MRQKTITLTVKRYTLLCKAARMNLDVIWQIQRGLDDIKAGRITPFAKHKLKRGTDHVAKRCRYCREWYRDSVRALRLIKNKATRRRLKHLFEVLWINNCGDFDIIWYEFAGILRSRK